MAVEFIWKIISMVLFIIYASDAKNVSNAIPMRLEGRIVGGMDANIEKYPWQVALMGDSYLCGATIINEIWMLTAAHCAGGRKLAIRAGSTHLYEGGTIANVKKVIIHDNYNPRINNYDFALLQLDRPLALNNTKMTAAILPDRNERVRDRVKCTTSGWGITDLNSFYPSPVLQAVNVRIINSGICKFSYSQIQATITDQMICAGVWLGGRDACSGDSGGPLVCESTQDRGVSKLFGVTSWGYKCAEPYFVGVYARVQSVRSWIEKNTGI